MIPEKLISQYTNEKFHFEKVSKYANKDFIMPHRKTEDSAGYDFVVVEDTLVLPYNHLMAHFDYAILKNKLGIKPSGTVDTYIEGKEFTNEYYTLNDIAKITKETGAKPTLVSTGVKAYMPKNTYLELSVRSSCPLKYWLIMANGVGIIDSDYADNPDNEGEIFFQLINLSSVPIMLKKGDVIGQGIFKSYHTTSDDYETSKQKRVGGFGSTNV